MVQLNREYESGFSLKKLGGILFFFVENTVELLKRIIFVLFITETMAKNNLLSEQLAYIGVSCTPTHLHLCSYNAESICMKDGKDIDSFNPLFE